MDTIKIIENTEVAPGIYSLVFRRFFNFIPGQVLKITCNSSVEPRLYSIASGSEDANIQIIYDIKPEGQLTNTLKTFKQGDNLLVSKPLGNFICSEKESWWIATGTGIAPFYSMMRSGRTKGINLIHGVRNPDLFLFKEEFEKIFDGNYHRCCSGKKMEGTFFGRVTEYLWHQPALPSNFNYYLCGSAEMVVDVRDILIEKGIPFGNIFSEIYF